MKLDRDLQREVLLSCKEAYPGWVEYTHEERHRDGLQANLIYLHEHGLITGTLVNGDTEVVNPRITATGLDFPEDDGGVSAMLQTITVKIDQDDLRSLITARIEASDLPPEEKAPLRHAMRSLPAHALRKLTTRLINDAVDQWPGALRLFQTYVGLN